MFIITCRDMRIGIYRHGYTHMCIHVHGHVYGHVVGSISAWYDSGARLLSENSTRTLNLHMCMDMCISMCICMPVCRPQLDLRMSLCACMHVRCRKFLKRGTNMSGFMGARSVHPSARTVSSPTVGERLTCLQNVLVWKEIHQCYKCCASKQQDMIHCCLRKQFG